MLDPSWMHLCDNPDMMSKLGISTESGENHISLVTDMTCKENVVRTNVTNGKVITYPMTVVTEGPFMGAHHIMRVFSVTLEGTMGQLIGYVRIDWDDNNICYKRFWTDGDTVAPISARDSIMSKLRDVMSYLLVLYVSDDLSYMSDPDEKTYIDLNVPSFTGWV